MPDIPEASRKSAAEERKQRQAAALRENLRRRKEQARAKRDAEQPEPQAPPKAG
jgi:hypothetical protein